MPESAGPFRFSSLTFAIAVSFAVVVLAFLVNRFAPKKRKHVRRSVILALLYLLSYGAMVGAGFLRQEAVGHTAGEVAELLGALVAVNVGAVAIFDLALPAVGVEAATILIDIVVGIGYIVAILATMRRAGVDFSGIVATSALLTTITAFSLQGTLSNVVGGVALQLDNSLKVGDWVALENGKQGKVREIRWRYTVIETRDWDTMIVPNASLLAGTVTILGKREGEALQHRMWVYFNVDFRFSPTDVMTAVNDALQAAPIEGVASEPKPHAICFDFSRDQKDSFAYYAARYWLTDLARDDPTSSRVRERIYAALKRANIPLAVPAAQLWVEQDDSEHRERKRRREHDRRLKALAGVEFLKVLRSEELEAIATDLRYALFAPGEAMTRQGAVAHWLYILLDGRAEVRVAADGAEKVVACIDAPGFFGEMGLMTGEPRQATVVAVSEAECYRLDKAVFHRILTERSEIAAEVSTILAERRVGLQAVRENLDASARARRLAAEKKRILGTIQSFFGLNDAA